MYVLALTLQTDVTELLEFLGLKISAAPSIPEKTDENADGMYILYVCMYWWVNECVMNECKYKSIRYGSTYLLRWWVELRTVDPNFAYVHQNLAEVFFSLDSTKSFRMCVYRPDQCVVSIEAAAARGGERFLRS